MSQTNETFAMENTVMNLCGMVHVNLQTSNKKKKNMFLQCLIRKYINYVYFRKYFVSRRCAFLANSRRALSRRFSEYLEKYLKNSSIISVIYRKYPGRRISVDPKKYFWECNVYPLQIQQKREIKQKVINSISGIQKFLFIHPTNILHRIRQFSFFIRFYSENL